MTETTNMFTAAPWKATALAAASKPATFQLKYNAPKTRDAGVAVPDVHTAEITLASNLLVLTLTYGTATKTFRVASSGSNYNSLTTLDMLITAINNISDVTGFTARRKDVEQAFNINNANVIAATGAALQVKNEWTDMGTLSTGTGGETRKRFVNFDYGVLDTLTPAQVNEYKGNIALGSIKGTATENSVVTIMDDAGNTIMSQTAPASTVIDFAAMFDPKQPLILRGPVVVKAGAGAALQILWKMANL